MLSASVFFLEKRIYLKFDYKILENFFKCIRIKLSFSFIDKNQ